MEFNNLIFIRFISRLCFSRCSEHLVDAANIFNSVVKISRDSTEFEEGILTEFQNSIRRNPSLLEFRRHFFDQILDTLILPDK